MRRLLKLLALLGLSAIPALGQGVVVAPQPALRNTGTTVAAMVNATVTVCAAGASGLPCAPALVGATFKDAALTQPLTDPFFTDQNGNYSFAIAPGQYTVTVTQFGQGYSYQVTAQCPLNGACTWTGNQTFTNITVTGTCSGCGSGSPSAPAGSLQYANSTVSGFLGAAGITTPDGNSLVITGPIPFASLSAFARSQPSTTACSATATISLGTPTTATLSNNTCFQNKDGITIYGAGAATGLATPVLSTITPASLSVGGMGVGGGTGTPYTTVAGAAGSTTDSYTLVVRDKFGGYSAASTPVSTSTALASLGVISCPLTSMSRSGVVWTFNFTSACEGAVVGAAMSVLGSTGDPTANLIFNIQTVNSSSQVLATSQYNSASFGWSTSPSGVNASTGGTAYFMGSNHLQWAAVSGAWYYYVCAKRSGDANYHLIGHTFPSSGIYLDLQFDDYGSPVMDSQLYPTYIETGSDTPNSNDAICTNFTGLPDPLTTTVTAGGGTTTVTLNNAATTAVSGATAKFDDGPGLKAAAVSVAGSGSLAGEVRISSTKFFIINSYTQLPSNVTIKEAGAVKYNETVELQNGTLIDGSDGGPFGCQFCYWSTGGAENLLGTAYPAFYISGNNNKMANMSILTEGNWNGQSATVIDGSNERMDNVEFVLSQGTNDNYLASAIAFRGTGASNPSNLEMTDINFTASNMTTPTGIQTWFPYLLAPGTQNGSGGCLGEQGGVISMEGVGMYQRGFMQTVCNTGGEDWRFKNLIRQSGIAPLVWLEAGNTRTTSNVLYDNASLDTSGGGFLMVGNAAGNCGLGTVNVVSNHLLGTGQFNGCGPTNYRDSYNTATGTLPNYSGKTQACAQGTTLTSTLVLTMNCNFDYDAYIGPNAKIYFPMAAPTSPTATVVSGGAFGASISLQFEIVAKDPAGNLSLASVATSTATTDGTCSGSGNCQFSVGWTPSLGEGAAAIYACQVGSSSVMPQCPTFSNMTNYANVTTNPVTFNSPIGGGSGAFFPPSFSLAGQAGQVATVGWGLLGGLAETTAPTCLVNYDFIFAIASGHRLSFCNNAGSVDQVVGAATADTLTNKTISAGTFTGAGSGSGSILITGQRDGLVPVNATTTTSCTFGTVSGGCFDKSYVTGYAFNQDATAGAGVTYTLPLAQGGRQYCTVNSYNGSAANTGVLTVATNTAGQFIIFTDGTLTASGGNVTSGGAAADAACFVGIDSTHWQMFTQSGTWTKH